MGEIAVFAASDLEFNTLRSILDNWQFGADRSSGHGICRGNQIELYCIGMGPRNAGTQASRALAHSAARLVIVSGLAGGLTDQTRCGDLVLYQNCYYATQLDDLTNTRSKVS